MVLWNSLFDENFCLQLPSHAQWGSQPVTPGSQKTKSLLEIQEQEERERREKEEVRRGVQLGEGAILCRRVYEAVEVFD